MILSLFDEQQLTKLRVYSISSSSRMIPRQDHDHEWFGRDFEVTITLSGYGTTNDKSTPTWQSSGTSGDIESAFTRALTFAPAQRQECDARAAGRLSDILPEYDPDGTRFPKRTKRASAGKKISAEELAALLGI